MKSGNEQKGSKFLAHFSKKIPIHHPFIARLMPLHPVPPTSYLISSALFSTFTPSFLCSYHLLMWLLLLLLLFLSLPGLALCDIPILHDKQQKAWEWNIPHSQLHNIVILKLNSPILLNLLGNIMPYGPAVGAIRRINSFNIDLQGRSILDL